MTRSFLLGCALLAALPLAGQAPGPARRIQVGGLVGALLPTGAQRHEYRPAMVLGVQGHYLLAPHFRLALTGAWANSHHKFPAVNDRVDIWQYDAGLEFVGCGQCIEDWYLRPFLGLGAGARTYSYHATAYDSHTCLAGYGVAGAELQGPGLSVRLEGRDDLSCTRSPLTGDTHTRNDVRIAIGVALRL